MLMHLFKAALAALLLVSIPHRVVYAALALLYFGGCFGLDKTILSAALALGYALLALERH